MSARSDFLETVFPRFRSQSATQVKLCSDLRFVLIANLTSSGTRNTITGELKRSRADERHISSPGY